MKSAAKKESPVYPELSYQIVGCAYEVWDSLGAGQTEKSYLDALTAAFKSQNISFKEQIQYSVQLNEELVGKGTLAFLVDEKVVIELKTDDLFPTSHITQVSKYMKQEDYRLGLLINFTSRGMRFKRIVNVTGNS